MVNMAKTTDELQRITKAQAMGDKCFSHLLEYIKVGMTETQVAAEIERVLLAMGAEGLAFPTICVSGERTCLPHGEPADKPIEEGDLVTIDMGAVVDGYCGDMTRTVAMGFVTAKQKEIYQLVLKAQQAGLDAVKSGVSCWQVDRVCRNIISQAGYREYFVHGTGHGVGREVHEAPALNPRSALVLCDNMAVTVEPGVYLPGSFGIRIEDLAVVTNFGIINVTKSPKELIILEAEGKNP